VPAGAAADQRSRNVTSLFRNLCGAALKALGAWTTRVNRIDARRRDVPRLTCIAYNGKDLFVRLAPGLMLLVPWLERTRKRRRGQKRVNAQRESHNIPTALWRTRFFADMPPRTVAQGPPGEPASRHT